MSRKVLLIDMRNEAESSLKRTFNELGYEIENSLSDVTAIDDRLKTDKQIQHVVITIDTPTESFFKVVGNATKLHAVPFIVFTKNSTTQFTEEAATIGISAYIVNGFEPGRLQHIMDLSKARFKELKAIKTELEKTKSSLAERKVIEKAKGILMRRRSIDEDAAFQMMRKMAMDKNQKLAEVAKNIVHVDTLFT